MRVFEDQTTLKYYILELKESNKASIGFVPTMGALHAGHASLIERSVAENNLTICSIFVNPTQFNNQNDLTNYPIQHNQDIELLEKLGCDIVYIPSTVDDVYQGETPFKVQLGGLDKQLEGKYRPGHFDGVMRVVKLLFEITTPNNAYFGLKDYQQYLIIKEMTFQLNLPVSIIGCEIKRDEKGLALSSRNALLTEQSKSNSYQISKSLNFIKDNLQQDNFNEIIDLAKNQIEEIAKLDYLEIADENTLEKVEMNNFSEIKGKRAFIAAFFGDVRLIDNIQLH